SGSSLASACWKRIGEYQVLSSESGYRALDVKAEMNHVAISNHIVFAFKSPFAGILGALLTFIGNKVVVGDHFGANKTLFEIRVYNRSGLGGGGADGDCPGAHFLDAGGEVGLQVEKFVAGANNPIETGFVHAHFLKEFHFVVIVEFGNFCFDFIAHGDHNGAFFLGDAVNHVEIGVVFRTVFGDVGDVHHRLAGKQVKAAHHPLLVIGHGFHQAAGGFAFTEMGD